MTRLRWLALLLGSAWAFWVGMQLVHELGHCAGAAVSGGVVDRLVLEPLSFSRTDLNHNPHPGVVVWAGPLLGVLAPCLAWSIAALFHLRFAYLLRAFAGFCLIANGGYIAVGSLERVADAGEMLRFGSPPWVLWAFGLVCVPAGFALWHGQGEHFGFGRAKGRVVAVDAYVMLALGVALFGVEVMLAVGGSV